MRALPPRPRRARTSHAFAPTKAGATRPRSGRMRTHDVGPFARVLDPPQPARALRLRVDGRMRCRPRARSNQDEVRAAVGVDRRQARDFAVCTALVRSVVHLGVILPNFDRDASPDGVRAVAEAAEELDFDSVWTTEHIIIGPEGVRPYGRVLDPLNALSWIAGYAERVGLGTSIVLVPLHHPIHLAKEAAALRGALGRAFPPRRRRRLARGRVPFMGVPFRGGTAAPTRHFAWSRRSVRRARVPRSSGRSRTQPSSRCRHSNRRSWVGGSSDRAIQRAHELGDVWHPSRSTPQRACARSRNASPSFAWFHAHLPRRSTSSVSRLRRSRRELRNEPRSHRRIDARVRRAQSIAVSLDRRICTSSTRRSRS